MRITSNQQEGSKNKKKDDVQTPDTSIVHPTPLEKGANSVSQVLPNPHEVSSKEDGGGKESYQETNRNNQIGEF